MKSLVVYDSVHGNTRVIAEAITEAITAELPGESKALYCKDMDVAELEGLDWLVIGAPTHGGRPAPGMQQFLPKLTKANVGGKKVASFDTRLSTKWVGIFGYAAGKIGKKLIKLGGELVADPEGFFVVSTEGPLKDGELKRAAEWAKDLVNGD